MEKKDLFAVIRSLELDSEEANSALGPLAKLQGTWVNPVGVQGWNIIAVPGDGSPTPAGGFVLEVIPYLETLTFEPVIVASNRGPVANGTQEVQEIAGLIYQQKIVSNCATAFCDQRGFKKGSTIHMESGMFLNLTNFSDGLPIGRMGNIPHGNTILALGTFATSTGTAPSIPNNSISPSAVTGMMPLGYDENQYPVQQFPDFDQNNPNSALQGQTSGKKFKGVTQLSLSTKSSTGGVLNIPFIQNNVNTTDVICDFWLEEIVNSNGSVTSQLQYSQTINLVFPATGDRNRQLINWPHVTVNTLVRKA